MLCAHANMNEHPSWSLTRWSGATSRPSLLCHTHTQTQTPTVGGTGGHLPPVRRAGLKCAVHQGEWHKWLQKDQFPFQVSSCTPRSIQSQMCIITLLYFLSLVTRIFSVSSLGSVRLWLVTVTFFLSQSGAPVSSLWPWPWIMRRLNTMWLCGNSGEASSHPSCKDG